MKIVMVIDRFGDVKNGAIQSTIRFVEYLRKKHEVTVIAAGDDQAGMIKLQSFFIPFVKQKMIQNGMFFAFPEKDLIVKTIRDADIVHIQFPFYLGWKVAEWTKELNKPLVCSYHVQPENILYNLGIRSKFLINKLHRFFNSRFYNLADAVISPSQLGRNELLSHGLTVPCHVISNGYIHEFNYNFENEKIDFEDRFVILSLGRISREKNHLLLVDAIYNSKYRNSIQLVIIGNGPDREKLKNKMKKLPNAILTGSLPQEMLLSYFNSAHIYIHPSLVELESLAVLEAMAEGLPIIVSNSPCSAAQQFVTDEKRIFQFDDSRSLTEKINYFFENRDELDKAADLSLQMVKNYTIEESVKKLLDVYNKCIGGNVLEENIVVSEKEKLPSMSH